MITKKGTYLFSGELMKKFIERKSIIKSKTKIIGIYDNNEKLLDIEISEWMDCYTNNKLEIEDVLNNEYKILLKFK